ncbi:hypothetical protein A3A76_05170 [Candidatus Woesebacteria bacterium RIFCSPLOWO2_01_FULL_39_23]|uniref:Hemolysin A, 23S rRNA (Cytidine1920-2'-O)/16S rRNA (Cytidine1409-2'-O)-methyltransferase n=3 Tax=Microgenomates group TaxID=1794810 RepID=A0A0H4TFW7_9BACT|nr:hemolysin A, 23S rRNA (cytidine1920-2'-O)/16S rRNA (cytidine1409-2'-O)-methyltransferase [uncultured Microgenomates bacterium Rifle_16ft_4_minimus_37633]AKQ05552.1 hemolysin A, 23S rRNA (cytidine1920-2'-O)/16S rRNA (cytidine1409-2'-O)-methyltransferase [uncultured Microgenomates bacterium Rifle_16ft_4_minimus_24053]OGM13872.1 MAG: hypothetical protein A2141_04395 [Candidatus Woesebacteria bacterium RBG_16_40_11]OGM27824.1 MAG: hypothetical protein A2628_05390 [Candidatus Woesebacteria bacteri
MNRYASRAGEKLQFALDKFKISVKDLMCADFGSSTGGFVDCLLQNGAKKVYSVDTAYGELAWNLRNDPRVVVIERTNAMHVVLPEKVDLITIDVGWTKQKDILPNAFNNLTDGGTIVTLIKPHYELGRGKLKVGQVEQVLQAVQEDIRNVGGKVDKLVESPLLGEKGKNREFLALIKPET